AGPGGPPQANRATPYRDGGAFRPGSDGPGLSPPDSLSLRPVLSAVDRKPGGLTQRMPMDWQKCLPTFLEAVPMPKYPERLSGAGRRSIPLFVKVFYTLFVATLVPYYWH